jgi:hypothetical protein
LTSDGRYNYAFLLVDGLLHETVDGFRNCFCFVKKDLLFVVFPIESKVVDSERLPLVFRFSSSAVNDAGDLI